MAQHKLKFGFYLVITIILTFGLSIALQSILAAWQAPTAAPPAGNTYPPIYNEYTGSAGQALIGTTTGISGDLLVNGDVGAIKYCNSDGTVCKSLDELVDSGSHYFLLSNRSYNGNLLNYAQTHSLSGTDGLTAADAICLDEVNTYDFKGKNSRTFTSSEVHAFLCDQTSCNPNPTFGTVYTVGVLNDTSTGGTTIVGGHLNGGFPFGSTVNYWTGRALGNGCSGYYNLPSGFSYVLMQTYPGIQPYCTVTATNCNGWTTSSSLQEGIRGISPCSPFADCAVNSGLNVCSNSNKLICVVDGAGTLDVGNNLWTQGTGNNIYHQDGMVSIGTSSANYRLTVLATSSGPGLYVMNDENNPELAIGSSDDYWSLYMENSGASAESLNFWNGDNMLTIANSGDIGIGTTTPGAKLEVNGGIKLNATDSARPVCTSNLRGTLWFKENNNGTDDDSFAICRRKADGTYLWTDETTAPAPVTGFWQPANSQKSSIPKCSTGYVSCADSSGYTCKSGSTFGNSVSYDIWHVWECSGGQISQIYCCKSNGSSVNFVSDSWQTANPNGGAPSDYFPSCSGSYVSCADSSGNICKTSSASGNSIYYGTWHIWECSGGTISQIHCCIFN